MRIVAWIGDEVNQKALVNKIAKEFDLVGIITESKLKRKKKNTKQIFNSIIDRIMLKKMSDAWFNMIKFYKNKYSDYPNCEYLNIENINNEACYKFTKALKPDLIIVSGTRLVKERLMSINPEKGILNLHTGISPYVKGGPNCTNWCIVNKDFHLIGNTIMWIDLGIDTGNLILTEATPLNANDTLNDVHLKVMEHAHELYLKAIKGVEEGTAANVPQKSIVKGKTYYSKQWTRSKKIETLKNFKYFKDAMESGKVLKKQKDLKFVSLKSKNS